MTSFPIAGNCLEFLFFNKRQENLTQITAPQKSTIIRDVDVTVVLVPHVGVNCLKIHFKSTIAKNCLCVQQFLFIPSLLRLYRYALMFFERIKNEYNI